MQPSKNSYQINDQTALLTKNYLKKLVRIYTKYPVNQAETATLIGGTAGIIVDNLCNDFLGTPMAKSRYIETILSHLINTNEFMKELISKIPQNDPSINKVVKN